MYTLHLMRLSKTYEPKQYESDIYKLWETSGSFKPKGNSTKTYTIVMPPPNANAGLHIGYTLTTALEDISARYHRMKGDSTLLLPGADHAGFETQVVYEKHLAKEGKSRFDFSRDDLYQNIWDFVDSNKGLFENQIRQFGASCDWTKFTFTLDPKIISTAYTTFKKMWDEGLIYRGERLVNYCTFHGTGFADIEVAYEDATSPLYYLKYGPFELATTRPETKFGDTAVAVHPKDKRYKEYVGKTLDVEGVNGKFQIKVVADEMVDRNFGTGVVKITPAHDFNDFEVAERHNLPRVVVIDKNGRMNEKAGRFKGMTVSEAREAVATALEEKGLLIKIDKDYKNRVGKCYKCGTVIEPMLMNQWFINMKPLAKEAIAALKAKKIKFYPDSKRTQLINYLEGLRDWNISRQIAWGIPIPAFVNENDENDWIYDERVDHETIEIGNKIYRRDPDVFDTWFSSSSWPYATLGLPADKKLERFYPNGLMETGGEILYPWVSRMIMMGLYNLSEVPFKEVYIHGYVMAEDGAKMSKSLGNVVDPIPIIEEYGSDAMRMGIIWGRSAAVNTGYDHRRVVEARNFCNKLWNIARYVEGKNNSSEIKPAAAPNIAAEHWIIERLNKSSDKISKLLERYDFSEAYDTLYHLIWDDIADWYIEATKNTDNKQMLNYVLETALKLAHPFAPFLTETIWQTLYPKSESLLISELWPKDAEFDKKEAAKFKKIQSLVVETRHIKSILDVRGGRLNHTGEQYIVENKDSLKLLAGLDEVLVGNTGILLISSSGECRIDLSGSDAMKLIANLKTKVNALEKSIKNLKSRLNNSSYIEKAPKQLVEETKSQLISAEQELEVLTAQIKDYSKN